MKYNNIIIDGNNQFHKNWSIYKTRSENQVKTKSYITEPIEMFLMSIRKIERNYLAENGTMYILFDNVTSKENYRKQIDPKYKANREKGEDSYYKCIEYIQLFLLSYSENYKLVYRQDTEADDLVWPLMIQFRLRDTILISSEDFDWARCMEYSENVYWYKNKEIYDRIKFKQKYGFEIKPNSIVIHKSFRGDASDNIPNACPGIREKDLIKLIQNYSSIKEILNDLPNIDYISDTWKNKIALASPRLRLNEKLVGFINICDKDLDKCIYHCKFEPKILTKYYKSMKFQKFYDYRLNPTKSKCNDSFFKFDKIQRI